MKAFTMAHMTSMGKIVTCISLLDRRENIMILRAEIQEKDSTELNVTEPRTKRRLRRRFRAFFRPAVFLVSLFPFAAFLPALFRLAFFRLFYFVLRFSSRFFYFSSISVLYTFFVHQFFSFKHLFVWQIFLPCIFV